MKDEAVEMYGRAANLFKMAKKWKQAGDTFTKIAGIQDGVSKLECSIYKYAHISHNDICT